MIGWKHCETGHSLSLGFGDGLIIERARASEFCPSAARRVHAFDSILDDMIALELRDCGEDVIDELKCPPSKRATIDLPATGDRPGRDSIRSSMADGLLLKIARIGFSNQILRDFKGLGYIRQPTMNFPG